MPKTMENIDMLNVPLYAREAYALTGQAITVPSGDAGDVVDFFIPTAPICNAAGNFLGGHGDSSLVFNTGVFDTEVKYGKDDDDLAQGEFYLNYLTGEGRGKKATSGTSEDADFIVSRLVSAAASGGATEAKQNSQIAQETAINTVLGAKDDTVASSDTGTFSLAALVKRGLQTLASLYGLVAQKTNAAISGSASSITAVAAVVGQTTKVYRLEIVADAATNITIKSGSTNLTGAMPISANGSISFTSNYGEPIWTGGSNEAITIDQSGSANIRGYISYVTSA